MLARGTTDYREDGGRVGDYESLARMLDTGLQAVVAELTTRLETLLLLQPGG